MKTVAEILKETGLTDEQIAALDPKITAGLTTVVSSATQTLEQAELAKRSVNEKWDSEISPALDGWANDKAALSAENAALRTALTAAAEGGFKVPDILKPAPVVAPAPGTRGPDGKFVAGTTGSPEFVRDLRNEAGAAIGSMLDLTWKYSSLFGKPMPDSPTTLIREATAQRLDPVTYAAKKYGFAERETAIKVEEQKKHDDAIRVEATAEADKKWAERVGSNPNVRQAETSKFSVLNKAVSEKQRPDPLTMTREQRHTSTQQAIHKEIAVNESARVQ